MLWLRSPRMLMDYSAGSVQDQNADRKADSKGFRG